MSEVRTRQNYFYVTRLMEESDEPGAAEIPLTQEDLNEVYPGDLLRVTYFNEPVSKMEALEQIPIKDSLGLSALYMFEQAESPVRGRRPVIRLVSETDLPGSPQFRRLISSPPQQVGDQVTLQVADVCSEADSRELCERLSCRYREPQGYYDNGSCTGAIQAGWFKKYQQAWTSDGFNGPWAAPRNLYGYPSYYYSASW